ncbi:hypothetical protein [Haladaptatus sp. DYF46]|uniref:hypothetical protein n=1 Tax=Haladaptatus sp. DYF46 TaxID=2886041 RepID=UPI001E6553AF|nr:hypothetical protein [Haladaptatus sp. DYF46]
MRAAGAAEGRSVVVGKTTVGGGGWPSGTDGHGAVGEGRSVAVRGTTIGVVGRYFVIV